MSSWLETLQSIIRACFKSYNRIDFSMLLCTVVLQLKGAEYSHLDRNIIYSLNLRVKNFKKIFSNGAWCSVDAYDAWNTREMTLFLGGKECVVYNIFQFLFINFLPIDYWRIQPINVQHR